MKSDFHDCKSDRSGTAAFQRLPLRFGGLWLALRADFQKTWLHVLILVAAGFTVHFPALQGQPVWDDDYLTRTNPFIKSPLLILEAFRHFLFPDSYAGHYRPVQNLSYMVDYFFWKNNFYGFHLSSILYHLGSSVLLYLLLRRLLRPLLICPNQEEAAPQRRTSVALASIVAFLVATLWVVHPVHSAAVDYVSGRADSLALFFSCGGWLLYLRAREILRPLPRRAVFAMAWLSGLLGLCSRENACVLAVLFLLYLFTFEKSMAIRRKGVVLVACLAMLGIYGGLRSLPVPQTGNPPSHGWSLPERAVLMSRALGDYGGLMIFPANLRMERNVFDPRVGQSNKGWRDSIHLEYLSIAGLLVIAAFFFGALWPEPGRPLRVFGAAWFLLAYLPISNVIELNATVAEHWLYVPSIGFLIFLAGVALALPARWRSAAVVLAGCALVALGIRSMIRSSDWLSNEVFARRTMAAGGASARIALLLGQTYTAEHKYSEAERIYRKALEVCPNHPIARNNLADVLTRQGKEQEAKALFVAGAEAAPQARKEYPRTWMAALNLARVHHEENNDVGALAILRKAQQDYPKTWALISCECELLRRTSQLDKSLFRMTAFARDNWWHHGAFLALGRLYWEKGETDRAEAAFRHASRLDVHDVEALNLMATMRLRQNRLEEACRAQRRAVARQPDKPRQYIMLSNILEKMGRNDEARAAIAQVTRLQALAENQAVAN